MVKRKKAGKRVDGRYAHLNPKLAVDRPFEGTPMNGNGNGNSKVVAMWLGLLLTAVLALGAVAVSWGSMSSTTTEHARRLDKIDDAMDRFSLQCSEIQSSLKTIQTDIGYLRRDVDARRGIK